MTTLIDTIKPTESHLEAVLPVALDGVSEAAFVHRYIANMATRLKKDPLLYRLYGPWWPALKALMLTHGDTSLGQQNAGDIAAIYSYDRPALTILAAHLYSDNRIEAETYVYDAVHYLDVADYADDTEPYVFNSYDESIEKYGVVERG